jgi:solute carrier family 25 protein 39/40
MAVPANVIYFTGYDSLRYNPRSPINRHVPETYAPLVAGSLARICAATVISPVEMFRTRLQASTHSPQSTNGTRPSGVYITTLRGLRELVHAQGYTSLWRGLTLTLWRDVPFSGIYWWGYEVVRNRLTNMRLQHATNATPISSCDIDHPSRFHLRDHQNPTATFTDSFIAGGISGTFASIITTPFDVGKTRRQVTHHYNDTNTPNDIKGVLRPEERSMPRFLWHIWQEEGVAGLWRGWAARCLKVAPACAIMISSYEIGKRMARGMNERREARKGGGGEGVE